MFELALMACKNSSAKALSVGTPCDPLAGSKSTQLRAVESPNAERCRRKFLRFFPEAFRDATYLHWERDYKWTAHLQWNEVLKFTVYRDLLKKRKFSEIAAHAVRIESHTNLLFSFEKMAIRDAVKSPAGARAFATGLFDFLYGSGALENKFEVWRDVVGALPRKQTRALKKPDEQRHFPPQ